MDDRLTPRLEDFPADARRIALTVSCRDSDSLPKVANAGGLTTVKGTPAQIMHNGIAVEKDGYCGAWMTEIIRCLRGHHEPQEEVVFGRIVERLAATDDQPSMIELGSYWAYYSLWFRRVMPAAAIVALEPDPAFLDVGRRNFALNDETAIFIHGAIGPSDAPAMPFDAVSDGRRYDVKQHDLRSLMSIASLDHVSLVLADIQGAETYLVEQARPLLAAGLVRFMIVSTHHHLISGSPTTHQDLLSALTGLGGHVIAEHSVGESFSGDGLLAVSFDPRDRDLTVAISHARQRDSLFGELEADLAEAWARAASAEEQRDLARAEAALSAQSLHAALAACHAALQDSQEAVERMRLSRVWRWSARPRAAYAELRRMGRRR